MNRPSERVGASVIGFVNLGDPRGTLTLPVHQDRPALLVAIRRNFGIDLYRDENLSGRGSVQRRPLAILGTPSIVTVKPTAPSLR